MTEHNPLREGVQRGDLVDGRYRVISRIGSGGMADVYEAEDQQLGRRVALKVMHRRFSADQEFVERFRREASAAAGLQHPNVVQVFDRGSWDGTYYIAMEYLDGRSLKQVVRQDAPLAPTLAVDMTVQILRAARFAHKRGIIHRDIKPHNVIVDAEGRVKVTDFGIARAGASDMTETGAIMGTAAYLSPEQAQGHAVSASSDIYSIGIVLYELLTGRVPFDAESAVTIALKQVSEDPVPPRTLNAEVSPELEEVVLRALQKDPARRYADADEFIEALESVRDLPARPGAAPREGALTGVYPAVVDEEDGYDLYPEEQAARSWRRGALVLIVLLALAGIGVGAYLVMRPAKLPVPNVVKLKADVAAAKLNNAGFEVDIQDVRSADRPTSEVIRQRPSPGELASKGATVTIFVSTGPGQAEVPDVTGATLADARRVIKNRGFKVEVNRQFSDSVAAGRVIETRPSARTPLDIGRPVTVVVSRGPELVAVPDVRGLTESEARAKIDDAKLAVETTEKESTEPPGTVLEQDPAPGTDLRKGDAVTLTLAKEPAKVAVPDVTGDTVNDALDALSSAGFRPSQDTRAVDTPDQDGYVVAQRPKAGTDRKKGSKVTIVVGRFEPPLNPEPSLTPTPTPTPTP